MLKIFSKSKRRVAPGEPAKEKPDNFISERYEDTAAIIYFNAREGRSVYSAYVPWIQSMLTAYIPSHEIKEKYWLEQVPLYYNIHSKWTNSQQLEQNSTLRPLYTVAQIDHSILEIARRYCTENGDGVTLRELQSSNESGTSKFCIIL